MLKGVIATIPNYTMSYLHMPKKLKEEMVKLMWKFFWNGSEDSKKLPLLSQDKNFCPKDVGHMGQRNLILMNLVLNAKLVWNMYIKYHQNGKRYYKLNIWTIQPLIES